MKTIKESLQNLTDEQLRGAEWAFRYVLTSPAVRGKAREVVQDCVMEARDTMASRHCLLNTKTERLHGQQVRRTKKEILQAQCTVVGCCEDHANNQSCSCLDDAVGTTGCGICRDPNCRNPNGKH